MVKEYLPGLTSIEGVNYKEYLEQAFKAEEEFKPTKGMTKN